MLVVTAVCGGDDDSTGATEGDADGGATLSVPGDHATIQEAVDAAQPGDLILVAPGTYEEAVNVETDELTDRAQLCLGQPR